MPTVEQLYRWRLTMDCSVPLQGVYDSKRQHYALIGLTKCYRDHGFTVEPLPMLENNVFRCTLVHTSKYAMSIYLLGNSLPGFHVIEELP